MKQKYVYICAPFRAETQNEIFNNILRVKKYAKELWHKGYIPIYTHGIFDFLPETENNREKILQYCLRLIELCNELHILGYRETEGMRREIEYAKKKKKKIKRIKQNYE